jgi:hypothetical protein
MADTKPPFQPGQFVWSSFPYDENPLRPGPKEHVAYIADVRKMPDGSLLAVCFYTTSQAWTRSEKPPLGIIPIDEAMATALGQKSFVIDVKRIAYIPINKEFFSRIDTPDKGILPRRATKQLQNAILNTVAKLLKRPEYIIQLGPYRPPQGLGR